MVLRELREVHLQVRHKPVCPLQETNALLGGVIGDGTVQLAMDVQVVKGILALGAGGLLLVHGPMEDAVHCGKG